MSKDKISWSFTCQHCGERVRDKGKDVPDEIICPLCGAVWHEGDKQRFAQSMRSRKIEK